MLRLSSVIAAAVALAACSDQLAPTGPGGRDPAANRPSLNVVTIAYTDLGTLGGSFDWSRAAAINGRGQVVGSSYWQGPSNQYERAYLWQGGSMQHLGALGSTWSIAEDINDLGHVVGTSMADVVGARRAFLWQNGTMRSLGTLGGSQSGAEGVNDLGHVVGWSDTTGGGERAFLWRDGTMRSLGTLGGSSSRAFDISNAGQVVGWSMLAGTPGFHAVRWQNGVIEDLGVLGGSNSAAWGINELGEIVGRSDTTGGGQRAVLWQNGTMRSLGTLGGTSSEAIGVNELGQVVGASTTQVPGVSRAFIWQDGVMEDLGTLGGLYAVAFDINNDGQVVGSASTESGGVHAVIWEVAIRATIDIAPSDPTNTLKLSGKGTIQVAVLGTPYFDATRVDPASITLGNEDGVDAGVARQRNGQPLAVLKDADRDGDTDLVVTFDKAALVARGDLTAATTKLVLLGRRSDGKQVRGVNQVTVVP